MAEIQRVSYFSKFFSKNFFRRQKFRFIVENSQFLVKNGENFHKFSKFLKI